MDHFSALAGSSTCCGSSPRSQGAEIEHSYASDSERMDPCCQTSSHVLSVYEDGIQENPNNNAAEGCCGVEESKQKEDCCAAEDEESPCEEPRPCCGVDRSNREGCLVAAENYPLGKDKALKRDNYSEGDSKEPRLCCDLECSKPRTEKDGACCNGK